MRYDEKNLFPRHILDMEAKMKATHAMIPRGSRLATRAGASTRGKLTPLLEGQKSQYVSRTQKKKT